MSNYDVNNCSVNSLLTSIKDGKIAIPEIQRPFVWDSTKVRDLVDSLYHGYPVGYIIEWQNPDVKLKDGTLSKMGKKVLIDGQQRVTALAAAIVGEEVVDSHYKKRRICIAFNPLEECFDVQNSAICKNSQWIADISEVFKSDFDAFKFLLEYCKKNEITDQTIMSKLSDIITKLRAIQNNNLGVITLSHELDIDRVTDIFIRINSKGVVLSQADFAMSKISSNTTYNGNITRKVIDYFCHLMRSPADFIDIKNNDTEFVTTSEFDAIKWIVNKHEHVYTPDYTDVLRVAFTYKFTRGKISDLVSLLSGRDFEARDFKEDIEKESYNKLYDGVMQVVNKTNFERYLMILDSIGIVSTSLVRSQNVLNFGYIIYLALKTRKIESNTIERVVGRWVVLSILTSRYSTSPESQFDYDIKKFENSQDPLVFVEQTEAAELSESFWNISLIQRLDTSVASSPLFNVFLMAQAKSRDHGFLSKHIDVHSMLKNKGDIHHLFPKNYLIKNGIDNRGMYNQIANYVFLQSEINIKIRDNAPNVYMTEVFKQCETKEIKYGGITDLDELRENLKQNCIPDGFEKMTMVDYEQFLQERRKLMAKKLKVYYESLI